jgi:hypothetical protein
MKSPRQVTVIVSPEEKLFLSESAKKAGTSGAGYEFAKYLH